MKAAVVLLICSEIHLFGSPVTWTTESREIEGEQVVLWNSNLAEARQKSAEFQLEHLSLGLRNLGHRRTYEGHSPNVDRTYEALQKDLLSIPGHARYFADKVAAARAQSKDFITDRAYHKVCRTLLETLPHLPSPETVQVLGEMLESRADVLTPEEHMEVLRMKVKGGNHAWYSPSGMAGQTLQALEIRQCPKGTSTFGGFTREDIEPLRSWWHEVKSGERTFSFDGQNVKYRFKPDGSWETLSMAHLDDGPGRLEAGAKRPERRPVPARSEASSSPPAKDAFWPWIVGGGLVLAALVLWMRTSIFRKNRS